ncbi:MAG TPA: glycosyl hydrolase family 8 [Candidatus Paceibacterota bacterium]|nr:glycosyl hydrolase family 8 [Candidatus Paceibacterota bacterium]
MQSGTGKISGMWVYGAFACMAIAAAVFLFNLRFMLDARPPDFSQKTLLQAVWHHYKSEYLEQGTLRSLDKDQGGVTTSEGQSYIMLRSVWIDDKATFDIAWQWTKDNIQRKGDHLMSWLFGERPDGSYGVLTDRGGENTASDADIDIALSLLFASKRWGSDTYFGDAIGIIRDIWDREVVIISGKPYLLANDVEKQTSKKVLVVNPSYFAPYAFKAFKQADPDHDWLGLASTSYDVALESVKDPLDKASSAGLPPDWIGMDRDTGAIVSLSRAANVTTNFSFDALRLPWRFALDWEWNKDPRAKAVLDALGYLSSEWSGHKGIAYAYAHDGSRLTDSESAAMYGGTIGYFMASDPSKAKEVYLSKLDALYDPNESTWRSPLSYYDENWAWFGMALYAGELRNLYE